LKIDQTLTQDATGTLIMLEIEAMGLPRVRTELSAQYAHHNMLHEDFKPQAYEDTYRDSVLGLIKRKAKGEEIDLVAQEEPEQGDDLMAALEASLGTG